MNTFDTVGEAMLLAEEGRRQIADAIVNELRKLFRRIGQASATALRGAPGPHPLK